MAAALTEARIPFDVSWAIADCAQMQPFALAWIVLYGERQGGEFDWTRLKWKDRDAK